MTLSTQLRRSLAMDNRPKAGICPTRGISVRSQFGGEKNRPRRQFLLCPRGPLRFGRVARRGGANLHPDCLMVGDVADTDAIVYGPMQSCMERQDESPPHSEWLHRDLLGTCLVWHYCRDYGKSR